MMSSAFAFSLCIILVFCVLGGAAAQSDNPVTVTIIYDNTVFKEGLQADWGFSCLIEGMEKTILFDTGTQSDILLGNMAKLSIDPKNINDIVISHAHYDHTGGLAAILERNSNVTVWLPVSFPRDIFNIVEKAGAKVVRVKEPVEVCKDVFLTGEIDGGIIEQALILETGSGSVLITGCAHPGIVDIVKKAEELRKRDLFFVFGGFHLTQTPEGNVREIVKAFQDLGVKYAGATHCTGEQAIGMFRLAYGDHFVQLGAGRILSISSDGIK
ncbi:MBL fold metallo-hydrolase [candidate division KSB1 bacterium]